jgi:hypothetical protein
MRLVRSNLIHSVLVICSVVVSTNLTALEASHRVHVTVLRRESVLHS